MDLISLVVPVYNEQEYIDELYERVCKVFDTLPNYDFELIYVDNRSIDNTPILIGELCKKDPRVKTIIMSRNTGYYALSYLAGLKYTSGKCAIMLDGDIQDPPEYIPNFIAEWEKGNEVVFAIREKRMDTPVWLLLYKIFGYIFSLFSDVAITNNTGDFSLLDRKVVDHIISWNEKSLFFRGSRAWAGFQQSSIKYTRDMRRAGIPKNNFWKKVEYAKLAIFSYSNKPLTIISNISIVVWFISLGIGGYCSFISLLNQDYSNNFLSLCLFC